MGSCCIRKVCFMKVPSELLKNLRGGSYVPRKTSKNWIFFNCDKDLFFCWITDLMRLTGDFQSYLQVPSGVSVHDENCFSIKLWGPSWLRVLEHLKKGWSNALLVHINFAHGPNTFMQLSSNRFGNCKYATGIPKALIIWGRVCPRLFHFKQLEIKQITSLLHIVQVGHHSQTNMNWEIWFMILE